MLPSMSTDIDAEVLAALNRRKGDWQAVSLRSGVSYSWLSKFANGHIKNPGLGTLKKLRDCLKPPKPLKVSSKAPEEAAEAGEA